MMTNTGLVAKLEILNNMLNIHSCYSETQQEKYAIIFLFGWNNKI
jgi:hypothetical protein